MRFYRRRGPAGSEFVEDQETFIAVGRWTGMFNVKLGHLFVIPSAPIDPLALMRPGESSFERIGFKRWWQVTGLPGLVFLLESFLGKRLRRQLATPSEGDLVWTPPKITGAYGDGEPDPEYRECRRP